MSETATEKPPGIKKIKRGYVSAREVYHELDYMLKDLQKAAAHLPTGILAPAIDLMYDKLDAAAIEYRKFHALCVERKIRSACGVRIHPQFVPLAEDE